MALKKRPNVLSTHLTPVGASSRIELVVSRLSVAVDSVGLIVILIVVSLGIVVLVNVVLSSLRIVGDGARRITNSSDTKRLCSSDYCALDVAGD